MMNYANIFFLLIISAIGFSSCFDGDDESPSASVEVLNSKNIYFKESILSLQVNATDNVELVSFDVSAILNDVVISESGTLSGEEDNVIIDLPLNFEEDGRMTISVQLKDKDGNTGGRILKLDYLAEVQGSLDINVKLEYQGEPLVMFTDYSYPDGRPITFTRFSFYSSEVMLDESQIQNVEFHNLTNNNAVPEDAANGFVWSIACVPPGEYNQFSFALGVPEELNEMGPSDFLSSHPLSRSSEHWFSWDSYIFCKLEGNLDSNNDGIKDVPIALHLGSDNAFRSLFFEKNISITSSNTTEIELVIDIYHFFGGETSTFDIDTNDQIHNLDQIPAIEELADNFKNNIELK